MAKENSVKFLLVIKHTYMIDRLHLLMDEHSNWKDNKMMIVEKIINLHKHDLIK